jgi:puromycin-sensitive aminopeptidase
VLTEADFRLPRSVVPRHYTITMEPDLEAFTFKGSELVDVDVVEPVEQIVINALDIVITAGELVQPATGQRRAITPEYDPDRERATLILDAVAEPGMWELSLDWTGELNDQLHGFYRSTYQGDSGEEKILATTQFESTHARRAVPCWDEPDLKATFGVTLIVDEHLTAISNQPETEREPIGDGRSKVTFKDTMVMPVYLLTFIVGELETTEPIDVDGTPLRIVHRPGQAHLTAFALEAGAHGLRYLADYYDIPYPGDKLDMIAIPDFAWGAMENLGAITFRDSDLLVDPERATQAEIERVAGVVNHELAHMWFGDLVTMRWWDGVWLNEAFATFMEVKAQDHFRPEWHSWLYYGADRNAAMEIDALTTTRSVEFPVASPEESNAMFDVLTYEKGSAVLRMLEQYLGEAVFRSGISTYLRTHAYGNTVTDDLWAALESVSGEPVGEIMHPWIYQGGLPHLHVAPTHDGYQISQDQFRYLGVGDGRWKVPVLYRTADSDGRLLLDEPANVSTESPIIVNAGGHGFYRIRYDASLLEAFEADMSSLDPAERYALVKDVWASVLAGETPVASFLDLASTLADETEPMVWNAVLPALNEIRHVASSDDRHAFEAYIRDLTSVAANRLGWVSEPGEPERVRQWRGDMLRAMGVMGSDGETMAQAGEILEQARAEPDTVDADAAAAALSIVAAGGGMAEFESFVERFLNAETPQESNRYRRALTAIPEPEAAERTFEMVLDGTIRRQDATSTLSLLLGHRDTGVATWQRVKARWSEVVAALDPGNLRRILDFIYFRSEPEIAADIEDWLAANPLPGTDRHTAQQLERLEVRVGLRQRVAEDLGKALS